MIDPMTDAAGAIEEIAYLAERLPTPDLREAIDKLLRSGCRASPPRRRPTSRKPAGRRIASASRTITCANIVASFRDRIAARAAP